MRKLFQLLFASVFLLSLLAACGSPQSPTEAPATESFNYEPDYSSAPAYYNQEMCVNTWIEKKHIGNRNEWVMDGENPKYTGLYATENQVGGIENDHELKTSTTTWMITLEYVRINDRVVYVDNWIVIQELRDPQDLSIKKVRELNSQPYIEMAKEMAKLAPAIRITATSKWFFNESNNYFEWSTPTTTCEVLK